MRLITALARRMRSAEECAKTSCLGKGQIIAAVGAQNHRLTHVAPSHWPKDRATIPWALLQIQTLERVAFNQVHLIERNSQ
ncbi:MAG: hypothetical protein WCS20_11625, partial [Alphaproteobacteria bacterium]